MLRSQIKGVLDVLLVSNIASGLDLRYFRDRATLQEDEAVLGLLILYEPLVVALDQRLDSEASNITSEGRIFNRAETQEQWGAAGEVFI